FVTGVLQQLDVLGRAEQTAELASDHHDRATIVDRGSAVHAAKQSGNRFGTEALEILLRLEALLPLQLADVELHEAINDRIEASLFLLSQFRQTGSGRMGWTRRGILQGVASEQYRGGEREQGSGHGGPPQKAPTLSHHRVYSVAQA